MALADVLSDIGKGAATAGRAALPVLERTAQVVSGEAPKIDEEERQRQQKLEDAEIETKAQYLENQLALGQKYGTLTPEQSQQYVDSISQLYSHPRHAGTLMEKLRKAIHPNGAVYTPNALSSLKNPVPEGGTAAADEANAERLAKARYEEARKNNPKLAALDNFTLKNFGTDYASSTPDQQEQALQAYVRASTKGSVGKSPLLTGDKLPPDAVGPDGQPIGPAGRDAAHSFVEYNGSWWPVAKPKPIFKTIGGWDVLVDPQTGAVLRKLARHGETRVTTRQTLQPGDDGQMHLVNLTSVSGPGGENIDVEPESGAVESGGESKPSTPAGKPKVGNILPKIQAKPVEQKPGGVAGKVVPGLGDLAHRKLQTTQDRQLLESSKQIISAVDDLLPILEPIKNQSGFLTEAKLQKDFALYRMGIPPSDPNELKMFENAALLNVVGASIWSRIGRSKYTFEVIRQHLPHPTDTPKLMYDKVKWLKEHVVPAAQEAILHPQPDDQSGDQSVDDFLEKF